MAEPQIRYCTTGDGASIAYATMCAVVIAPAGPLSKRRIKTETLH